MQYTSGGLGPSGSSSDTDIPRCSSNQGTESPTDGIMDLYLSDAFGCGHQLQISRRYMVHLLQRSGNVAVV